MALSSGRNSASARSGWMVTPPIVRTGSRVAATVRTTYRPGCCWNAGWLMPATAYPGSQSAMASGTYRCTAFCSMRASLAW